MDWMLLVAAVVLTIGNAELLITLINRIHSRPIPEHYLRQIRHLHDLLIPLFPVWLVVGVWLPAWKLAIEPLTVPSLWSVLPLFVQCYFGLCVAGCLGFVWSVLRYQTYRSPRQQTRYESRVVDIAAELGAPPIGPGPFQSLVRLPFNECFQVELVQRTLVLPRLPQTLDGLRILHLTDLHFIGTLDRPFFERLFEHVRGLRFDMAVLTGDLIDDMQLTPWIATTLGTIEAPLGKFSILGNHDWNQEPTPIRADLRAAGWIDVASRCEVVRHQGAELAIVGNELPWMGTAPSLENAPSGALRIALSHSPDNLKWARRQRVDLMLSGHNHGGQVVLPIIGPVFAPSLYGVAYAAGLFWRSPTLLCVGRGVSGRHPLRVRCRPEVAVLELRCEATK